MDERRGVGGGPPHELERIASIELDPVVIAPEQANCAAVKDIDGRDRCDLSYYHVNMLTR